ncbi:MAG: GAF domain-containing protein [Thermodesulfovibrionales bacterium]
MEKENAFMKSAEDFLLLFRRGEEFTKDILKENEKLRFRLAQLEEALQSSSTDAKMKLYEERIRLLEDELRSFKLSYREVEEENRDFASKYVEIEEENNKLANLYVATYQLHSTLDFKEVLRIVIEIVINLIGAEKFAVMIMDEKMNELVPVASEGVHDMEIPTVKVGSGIIGRVAKEGDSHFSRDFSIKEVDLDHPLVCIPLKIKEHVIGVIVIYALLTQKEDFTSVDYELFNLLAGHAATAIFSARLFTQSERKLTTIQSFLDLLKERPKK